MKETVPLKKKVTTLSSSTWENTKTCTGQAFRFKSAPYLRPSRGPNKTLVGTGNLPCLYSCCISYAAMPLRRPSFYYISKSQALLFRQTDSLQSISGHVPEQARGHLNSPMLCLSSLLLFKNGQWKRFHRNVQENFLCAATKCSVSHRSLPGGDSLNWC